MTWLGPTPKPQNRFKWLTSDKKLRKLHYFPILQLLTNLDIIHVEIDLFAILDLKMGDLSGLPKGIMIRRLMSPG